MDLPAFLYFPRLVAHSAKARSESADSQDVRHVKELNFPKAAALATPAEERHLDPRERRRKNRHPNNEENASFSLDSAKARNLLSLASHSSAGQASRDPGGWSQPDTPDCRNGQFPRSECHCDVVPGRSLQVLDKETSTEWSPKSQAGRSLKDAQTPEKPILQKEQIRNGGPIVGIRGELITEARPESQQSGASKERLSSRIQYDHRTPIDVKLRGGNDTIRQAIDSPSEPVDKAAITVPHPAHLHPTLSAPQTPITNPTKRACTFSSSEGYTSIEEAALTATKAEIEILDSSPQPTNLPRRQLHQRSFQG